MSNTMLWAAIAVGELLLIVFGLLLFAWISSLLAKKRDRAAVRKLVAKVHKTKGDREEAIRGFLSGSFALDGDELERETTRIARAELFLVQEVANLYRHRDDGQLVKFPIAYEAAIAPYWDLTGSAGGAAADADGAENPEVARLRDENQRLSDELQITMDTMSRMLSEYSAMFAGATPEEVGGTEVGAVSEEITSTSAADVADTADAADPGDSAAGPDAADGDLAAAEGAAAATSGDPDSDAESAEAEQVSDDDVDADTDAGDESLLVVEADTAEPAVEALPDDPDAADALQLGADDLFDAEPEDTAANSEVADAEDPPPDDTEKVAL